jgi:signal transduction histidine kinase
MELHPLHLSHEGYLPPAADTGACAPFWLRDAARSASMNDFSASFNPPEGRPRRRFVPAPNSRTARPRPSLRAGALAVQAAASHAQACARGDIACRAAWLHVQALGASGLPALVGVSGASAGTSAVPPLAAIAAEVEHALTQGPRAGTARALVLLATLADRRFDDAANAAAIAEAAVALAAGGPDGATVRRLHAALMLPRFVPFAACLETFGPMAGAGDMPAALLWSAMRCAGGAPLPELLHGLEQVLAAATDVGDATVQEECVARLALLRALVVPLAGAITAPARATASFATWTLQLQLTWFSGDRAAARDAALAAGALNSPLSAPADLLAYHLFAALALAWDASPQYRHAMHWHRTELDGAAARCAANAGAMAALAGAVELASAGDVAGALRGYEEAAQLADRHGQTWVAALAWELAAALCQQCVFGAAMPAYRRRALMAWHACGAHGRIARLCRGWNQEDTGQAPAAAAGWCGTGQSGQGQGDPDEQRRVARASAVGELDVSIAHEVNQPLAAILLQAAAARRWLRRPTPDLDKALDALEQIAVSGRRAGDIVRSVQGLARRDSSGLAWFPVDAALDEAVRLLSRKLRKHGVHAELALTLGDFQIHANRAQVQQVVLNLLLNAIDALAGVEGRTRDIVLTSRRLGAGTVEISVADNGPGVAPIDRDHIFDALFSTKTHGTGVGLSISRAIAEAHGGHLAYRPCTPHGALFALVLAVDAAQPGAA